MRLTKQQQAEVRECHPEGKCKCYCDSGHERAGTVCMWCWHRRERIDNCEKGQCGTCPLCLSHPADFQRYGHVAAWNMPGGIA